MQFQIFNAESFDLDEELAEIKSKLRDLRPKKEAESPFNLSQISEKPEVNPGISLFTSDFIELKNIEVNEKISNNNQAHEKITSLEALLREKTEEISKLLSELDAANSEVLILNERIFQSEVDMEYCIEQQRLALDEISNLRSVLLKKDEMIKKMQRYNTSPQIISPGKANFKMCSELELIVKST